MRLSNDRTRTVANPSLTLGGIPAAAFEYRLGNRSALEWVIDRYQVSTDKRTGITGDRPVFAPLDLFALLPGIVPSQIDVFLDQWRQVRPQAIFNSLPMRLQTLHRSLQINTVP